MAYTFKKLTSGKVQIYENGKDISGTGYGFDESYAKQLGFSGSSGTSKRTMPETDPNDEPDLSNMRVNNSGSGSGNREIDIEATNKARDEAAENGENSRGIYVYKDGSVSRPSGTKKVKTSSKNAPEVEIPEELANDEEYQGLSAENQELAAYIISLSSSGNKADAEALKEALEMATEQADAYWGEKISIIKDELKLSLGDIDTDLAATERDLMLRKARIEEDLKTNKGDYTLDQQTELAAAAKNLGLQIDSTREVMASRGLTSSSIKNQAEERLNTANKDIVESTTRAYQRKIRDAETTAMRNVVDIQNQISDATENAGREKRKKVGAVEQYIGSGNMGGISGTTGGITGTLIGEQTADILARQRAHLAAEGLTV
jgi:hypothetical protein